MMVANFQRPRSTMAAGTIVTTTTEARTLQQVLDQANPDEVTAALQQAMLGTTLTPLTRTFTGLVPGTAINLTTIDGTGEQEGPGNPYRLPALDVVTLRVVAGEVSGSLSGGAND